MKEQRIEYKCLGSSDRMEDHTEWEFCTTLVGTSLASPRKQALSWDQRKSLGTAREKRIRNALGLALREVVVRISS
jgi:hypothetical protein